MTDHDPDKPDWWEANEELRREYDLPSFDPPSFRDGTIVHNIVTELEERHDCSIQFVNRNPTEDEGWTVLLDGTEVLRVNRYRNENANSVFELSTEQFRTAIETNVEQN